MRIGWLALALVACSGGTEGPVETKPPADPIVASAPSCEAVHGRLAPISSIGSPLQLATLAGETVAVIADADEEALRLVSLEGEEQARLDLGTAPSHALVVADGRVLVTLPLTGEVVAVELGPDGWEERCRTAVATEPAGLAADERRIVVASRGAATVTVLAARTLEHEREVAVARDPFAVAIDDGEAVVTHLVGGRLSRISLDGGGATEVEVARDDEKLGHEAFWPANRWSYKASHRVVDRVRVHRVATQAYAVAASDEGLVIPVSLADPSRAPQHTRGYGGGASGVEPHAGVLVRWGGGEVQVPREDRGLRTRCTLPRGVAYDPRDEVVWVSCLDSNQVLGFVATGHGEAAPRRGAMLADLYPKPTTARFGFHVPEGPDALAIDPATRRLVIWSRFGRSFSVTKLPEPAAFYGVERHLASRVAFHVRSRPEATHALSRRRSIDAVVEAGRRLFHRGSIAVSGDGRACASCHLDGRDDALTWTTSAGPRQTPILAERLDGTAPYGWDGAHEDVFDHIDRTVERLGGQGLSRAQRASLVAYVASISMPREAPVEASRGRASFVSDEVGCAGCHPLGEATTDARRYALAGDEPFDTPSLRFVARSAPYFHDGRYPTLAALLADPTHGMGQAARLGDEDRAALEAFLRTR